MASIASMLGVQWDPGKPSGGSYRLTTHAQRQALEKGFHPDAVLAAANDPHHTYANGRYFGQSRHVRDGIVAVVDPSSQKVITVYKNTEETAPRADQKDRDAMSYAKQYREKYGL